MNNLTAVMADFAANQADRDVRVGEQIAEFKAALIPLLRASGIARVEVCFDGSGDSGAVEEVLCFDAADNGLACPDRAFSLPCNDRRDGAAGYAPPTLSAALEQITYLALERLHPGWENNDGAGGQLVIDVGEGSFALDCSLRFIATDDHSTQI